MRAPRRYFLLIFPCQPLSSSDRRPLAHSLRGRLGVVEGRGVPTCLGGGNCEGGGGGVLFLITAELVWMSLIGNFPSLQVCTRCAAVTRGVEVSVNSRVCPKRDYMFCCRVVASLLSPHAPRARQRRVCPAGTITEGYYSGDKNLPSLGERPPGLPWIFILCNSIALLLYFTVNYESIESDSLFRGWKTPLEYCLSRRFVASSCMVSVTEKSSFDISLYDN